MSLLDHFNPCSPCGERLGGDSLPVTQQNFNPCSPCGERLDQAGDHVPVYLISIHAPRAGSDQMSTEIPSTTTISIHAPRAGSDIQVQAQQTAHQHFNPCSPCGERPADAVGSCYAHGYFNPCSPCGERPPRLAGVPYLGRISIHAPRAGSDLRQSRGSQW